MGNNICNHIRLGSCRNAGNRRYIHLLRVCELPDNPGCIQIIRPEIMPPLGQAMGFIKHPAADLPLADRLANGPIPQLLGRDIENTYISKPDLLKRLPALRRCQHAINRGNRVGSGRLP